MQLQLINVQATSKTHRRLTDNLGFKEMCCPDELDVLHMNCTTSQNFRGTSPTWNYADFPLC